MYVILTFSPYYLVPYFSDDVYQRLSRHDVDDDKRTQIPINHLRPGPSLTRAQFAPRSIDFYRSFSQN